MNGLDLARIESMGKTATINDLMSAPIHITDDFDARSSASVTLESGSAEVQAKFAEHGYVIFRGALPRPEIKRFLHQYEEARRRQLFVYYSQSLQTAMRPEINEFGFVVESMQNASRLALFPEFTSAFQACIYHRNVSRALTLVDGKQRHVSWQNMLFDQSTGTVEHQDSWYLDTEPSGGLVGAWFALEDIRPGAGAFFVCPGTHKLPLLDRAAYPNHDEYVTAVKARVAEEDLSFEEQFLDQGDLLIWHSFLIHGATAQTEPSLSRRSLTSHYYPHGARAKDTESKKLVSIYDHDHPRATHNPDIFTAYRFPDLVYNALVFGKYAWDRVTRAKGFLDMGRRAYDDR